MLELEHAIVKAHHWSLYEIDRTDIESLIPFLMHESDPTGGEEEVVYCDQAGWLL
jgi:hypothetical protein